MDDSIAYIKTIRGIINNGWCKGHLATNKEGKVVLNQFDVNAINYCLFGALVKAFENVNNSDLYNKVRGSLHIAMQAKYGEKYNTLYEFNDDISIKRVDVLLLIDSAHDILLKD
jgi:hypothetical protein